MHQIALGQPARPALEGGGQPAAAGMAHQEPGKAAQPQVHADDVGLQRFGWPFQFTATKPGTTPLGLEEAHRDLRISPVELDGVAAELGTKRKEAVVLAAVAAHNDEVTARLRRGR